MFFFIRILWKLQPLAKLVAHLAAIFWKVPWVESLLALSSSERCVLFMEVMSGLEPQYFRELCVGHQGKNVQDKKAIAVTCTTHSDSPIANLSALDISEGCTGLLGAFTVVRYHFSRCIVQHPGYRCQMFEVCTN